MECEICESALVDFNDKCLECISQMVKHEYIKEPMIFYNELDIESRNETDLQKVDKYAEIKKELLKRIQDDVTMDYRLYKVCNCGEILKRNLFRGPWAHILNCSKCGQDVCSNCNYGNHTFRTCEQMKYTYERFNSDRVQIWKALLISSGHEKKVILDKIKENRKMKNYLIENDARICPYNTWEGARRYEEDTVCNEKLTFSVSRENWSTVSCKSEGMAVVRDHCQDVTCGIHNIERIKDGDGISRKCCMRKIKWKYWLPFVPKIEKIDVKKLLNEPFKISKDVVPQYKCDNCGKYKTCKYIKCTAHECEHKYKKHCEECIVNNGITTKKSDFITLTCEKTGNSAEFRKNVFYYKGYIFGEMFNIMNHTSSCKFLNRLSLNGQFNYNIASDKYINLSNIQKEKITLTMDKYSYQWGGHTYNPFESYDFTIEVKSEYIPDSTNENNIIDTCINGNHVFEFYGSKHDLDMMEKKSEFIEAMEKKEKKQIKILDKIKKRKMIYAASVHTILLSIEALVGVVILGGLIIKKIKK